MPAVLSRVVELGELAGQHLLVLALALRAPFALDLVRKCLRTLFPHTRMATVAVLVAIDLPWSWRELRTVLAESTNAWSSGACRAALRTISDPALAAWNALHPDEADPHARDDEYFALALRTMKPLVERYRDRLGDAPI